jgi:hypothetical protein
MVAFHVGPGSQLGLHASCIALVSGCFQAVSLVSNSAGPLADIVGKAVAEIGSTTAEMNCGYRGVVDTLV